MHFKLEWTSCQQSLKYISLYNTEGAPFSTEKKKAEGASTQEGPGAYSPGKFEI